MAMIDYRSGRHCVFLLHIHFVFTTKYRRSIFDAYHIEAMLGIFTVVGTQCSTECTGALSRLPVSHPAHPQSLPNVA
jgi:hypothetical protein